jgi:flagellar biosynthesis/type III secretory pathway protein FliH
MGLVKASAAPAGLTTFSMRDVEEQARALLVRARLAAERLIAEAQREAAELKLNAHAQGFSEGKSEGLARGMQEGRDAGRQQALDEHRAQLTQVIAGLTSAMTDVEASRTELEAAALEEVVALAVAVARRVTKRQGLIEPEVLTENLREAMKLVVHGGDVKVAIHPTQRQALDAALPALRLEFPRLGHVELSDDSSVEPGGCRILAGVGQVDATLDEQLDRVVADLLPDPDAPETPDSYPLTRVKKPRVRKKKAE